MGRERRVARSDALLPERPGVRETVQPGLYVRLRLREKELPGSVLYRQDAAVLQQGDVQGSRARRAAQIIRRAAHLLAGQGQGREDRLSDAELRLAVLAADEDERHRVADARPEEARLQHAGCRRTA